MPTDRTHLVPRPGALLGWLALLALVGLVASPVAVVAWSLVDPATDVWAELWRTRLPGMLRDTLLLLSSVVVGSVVLGTGLAWLVGTCSFPGRRLVGWLLVTPLAIPGYVGGFVWLDSLAGVLGARAVRSLWVCAVVLVLSLYPYVYLFARAAFAAQGAHAVAAARSLGSGHVGVLMRVMLPAARPAIAAGAALVAMEVLTDIGTVRLFNVSTLADGVMRVWFATGDRGAATEIASALTLFALFLIALERLLRSGAGASRGSAESVVVPRDLSLGGAVATLFGCITVLAVATGVPLVRLAVWAARSETTETVAGGIGHHVGNTVTIAGAAALVCIALGTCLALVVVRRGRLARAMGRLSTVGYAMPGPVVAVGVVVMLAAVDRRGWLPEGWLLVGSVGGLVFALVVRFLAVGFQGVESGLDGMSRTTVESARVLGAGPVRTALRVELPTVRFGVLAAAALLIVDTVKELPITLLLRPFGVDTLSVWVWQATSESLWEQAAVPALLIVAIGMVAVGALLWAMEHGARVAS